MILYSSELKSKPRCSVMTEYRMPMESFAVISLQLVDLVAVRVVGGGAVRFAHAVDDHDQAFVPAGRVERAGRVRQVMIYLMNFVGAKAGKMLLDLCEQFFSREDLIVLLRAGGVEKESCAIRRVVKAVGDLVDLIGGDSGRVETILNRADREVAGVLFAAEAFLGGAGHNFAIDQQDRRGIVSLRNAILAFLEPGPVRLLERNGILKPTYAQHFRHDPVSPLARYAGKAHHRCLLIA